MAPRIRCRVRRRPSRYASLRQVERDDYRGYHLGLNALRWLRHYFPDFWTRHLANTLLTPGRLYQACEVFLILVHHELFPIVDEFVGQWFSVSDRMPEHALSGQMLDDQAALWALNDAAPVLLQPWPRCYGLGIESLLDDDAPVDLLTFALWHMCDQSPWSLGVDLHAYSEHLGLSQNKVRFVAALPQIGGFVGALDDFTALLNAAQPQLPLGTLVAYAFGCTHNQLANTATDEIWSVHQGTTDLTWAEAGSYRIIAQEARQIEAEYLRWSRRVNQDPNILSTFAEQLCTWRSLILPS